MESILKIDKLTKNYGSLTAVNALDLSIDDGQVYGILGPNGSGKSTTLAMILGVARPTSGSYSWFGAGADYRHRSRIGAILESPAFYPYLSGEQNLRIVCRIKNTDPSQISDLAKKVGLADRIRDKFRNYSLGMKQRLAIASSLLGDPKVLILDEPTNGLDPQGIADIRELIVQIASEGKTIILASHLLDEVQKVCTHFAVLKQGRKLFDGSVAEATGQQSTIEVGASNLNDLKSAIQTLGGIKKINQENGILKLQVEPEVTVEYISKSLLENGLTPTHLRKTEGSLEQEFLKILQKDA